MGPDNIPSYPLKLALPYIVDKLAYIYNLCIEQNVFLATLKTAKVVPIPTANGLSDQSIYRPISLLH